MCRADGGGGEDGSVGHEGDVAKEKELWELSTLEERLVYLPWITCYTWILIILFLKWFFLLLFCEESVFWLRVFVRAKCKEVENEGVRRSSRLRNRSTGR
jgi:hypothetical protein